MRRDVVFTSGDVSLPAILGLPDEARGVVAFAHGTGSSRLSPRNRLVADRLLEAGLGILLLDLLTEEEDRGPEARFDVSLLAERLGSALRWLGTEPRAGALPMGLFGASTGAAAALIAAVQLPDSVRAVVSRGGRPDLAGDDLPRVTAPTLLIVGSLDTGVLDLNRAALERLGGHRVLQIVEGASHLFEEPGTLERVADLAADWFVRYL